VNKLRSKVMLTDGKIPVLEKKNKKGNELNEVI